MEFTSYTITAIDELKGHLLVSFTFKENKKEFTLDKRFDYRAIVGYDEVVMKEQLVQQKNKEGVTEEKLVLKPIVVHKEKKAFDLSTPKFLDESLRDWARAYIVGKEQEMLNKQTVSPAIKKLIGVVNHTPKE